MCEVGGGGGGGGGLSHSSTIKFVLGTIFRLQTAHLFVFCAYIELSFSFLSMCFIYLVYHAFSALNRAVLVH